MNFYEYFRLLKLIMCNCNDGNSIKKRYFYTICSVSALFQLFLLKFGWTKIKKDWRVHNAFIETRDYILPAASKDKVNQRTKEVDFGKKWKPLLLSHLSTPGKIAIWSDSCISVWRRGIHQCFHQCFLYIFLSMTLLEWAHGSNNFGSILLS